jgi:hypothetical protein
MLTIIAPERLVFIDESSCRLIWHGNMVGHPLENGLSGSGQDAAGKR